MRDLSLAGRRAAWILSWGNHHLEGADCLVVAKITPGGAARRVVSSIPEWCFFTTFRVFAATWLGGFLGPIAGEQGLTVLSSSQYADDCYCYEPVREGPKTDERLWRIAGDRLALIARGPGSYRPMDVDSGRIVVVTERGAVRLLDAKRQLLNSFRFLRGAGPTSAQLDGSDLVLVREDALEVWDTGTGQKRAAYPLERGFGPTPVVEDVQEGIATVIIGVAIHVIRLADGKDLVLEIPNQAGPVHAELDPSGLFYSWNEPHTRRPGRIAFLPFADLLAAFDLG